ncbi:hypothetical protein IJ21_36510 [Paenibacillus sp. 32O-W]|uniref:hypothetical protein n=1 Tax=Paenibacillus sp. 32O-W TaxID=1695218 RepID=UPI00071F990D|nr:hypothetical protein [Paenibacillus sp. 32O-W]ALS29039.1 hypothetical protein IJ21_36510 [Paenibacillus sp. 32O-W]
MKWKKHMTIASVAIAGALTAGVLSTFAIAPLASTTNEIKEERKANLALEQKVLVLVGETAITNVDLANYKSYRKIDNVDAADEELLKELITEQLLLRLAKEKKVYATWDQGMAEAKKNREILESQSQEVQDVQHKFIELTGLTALRFINANGRRGAGAASSDGFQPLIRKGRTSCPPRRAAIPKTGTAPGSSICRS